MTHKHVLVLVVAAACSKSGSGDKSGSAPAPSAKVRSDESAKPAPTPAAATTPTPTAKLPTLAHLFDCKSTGAAAPAGSTLPFRIEPRPSIPSVFGGATFGMTRAEAQKHIHAGKIEDGVVDGWTGFLYLNSHGWRRQFAYQFSANDKLENFGFSISAPELEQIEAVWGKPLKASDGLETSLAWFDPDAKIKVSAQADKIDKGDDQIDGYRVRVVPYLPLAQALGKDGVLAMPIIGKKLVELAKAYPDAIKVKTKAESTAELKQITNDKDLINFAAGDNASLDLPESEIGLMTNVQLHWDAQLKVTDYSLAYTFDKDKAIGDEILAQIVASLGQPTATKYDDITKHTTYTFSGPNGLVVSAELEVLDDGWRITVNGK